MQISRLFGIVYLLLNRHHITAKELAERFEVSIRTIYRDIDALSQAGVPVYATQGSGGGIFISDAYVLNKSTLSDREQDQILAALQSLRATGHTDADALLKRLGSMFDKDAADWIEVDFARWGTGPEDRIQLATIKDAILGKHVLRFVYYSAVGERTERTVRPVRLVYKSRAWYLQAFCEDRQDFRTFKVVRMGDLRMLEETFDREALPIPPPLETMDPNPVPPPNLAEVTLRFRARMAWRVLDEFGPSGIEWQDENWLLVHTRMPLDNWLLGYLLSFGEGAEVLEPPELREAFRAHLERILAHYKQT